jgi:8-oxo-dGTP pyrophosphatase MutT (NUDIX family)
MESTADQATYDLLAGHAPVDDAEQVDLDRIRVLLSGSAYPRARTQFDPGHLTASAVVVDAKRQRTLLIFHQKLQRWLQPGGHFEPDESDPLRAAQREVLEETGVRTQPPQERPSLLDVDVHQIPARGDEPQHEHFDLRFLLVAENEDAVVGDGAERVRWVPPTELDELDLDPGLRRALNKVWDL